MRFWEPHIMCATKDDGYLEKFYQLVGMSSCNNILQSHVGTLASSISRAFSNLFQPFKSHGDDEQSNGGTIFYCIDYEELIPLYTGSVVVLIWVIIFKVYIDSLNEMESAVSGHTFNKIRERLADKLEIMRFDPYIQQISLYREKKKIRSM